MQFPQSKRSEFKIEISLAPGPDYSAKNDSVALLKGDKKTHKEVDYRLGPQDDKKRCHECKSYQKPGQESSDCARVIGVIQAEGTCDLWSQRSYGES
jgi:hypothetical protein